MNSRLNKLKMIYGSKLTIIEFANGRAVYRVGNRLCKDNGDGISDTVASEHTEFITEEIEKAYVLILIEKSEYKQRNFIIRYWILDKETLDLIYDSARNFESTDISFGWIIRNGKPVKCMFNEVKIGSTNNWYFATFGQDDKIRIKSGMDNSHRFRFAGEELTSKVKKYVNDYIISGGIGNSWMTLRGVMNIDCKNNRCKIMADKADIDIMRNTEHGSRYCIDEVTSGGHILDIDICDGGFIFKTGTMQTKWNIIKSWCTKKEMYNAIDIGEHILVICANMNGKYEILMYDKEFKREKIICYGLKTLGFYADYKNGWRL